MSDDLIKHVSDTALWVASYRAQETLRSDAIFRDPFAAILVGDRGREIGKSMSYSKLMYWVMVVRTSAIDRLILNAIAEGVDTVINLGAGLDTRPYRMKLPEDLHWIEIDFPHMTELKNQKLQDQKPVCNLERISLNLSNLSERKEIFKEIGMKTKKALLIAEGLIPYLTDDEAASLSDDLASVPSFKLWIQDFHSEGLRKRVPRSWKKKMKSAPFKFAATDWFEFFKKHGWITHEKITASDEAERVGRPFPFIFPWTILMWIFRTQKQEKYRNLSGYVTLKRIL